MTVAVLMSTYNGEKFIREQIISILKQENVYVDIYIRDDGSSDCTVDLIKALKKPNIYLKVGKNIGACRSFFSLLYDVDNKYDYYAFADQDDIWETRKLIRGIKFLNQCPSNTAGLYFSSLKRIDENKNFIDLIEVKTNISFEFSLIRSVFPGCTMIFNKKVIDILRGYRPIYQIMHDQFIYQIVSGVSGKIYYDRKSYINYRIHKNNVSVYEFSIRKRLIKLLKEFYERPNIRLRALREFEQGFGEVLSYENHKKILEYISYKESNVIFRFFKGISIDDTFKYKILCAISMVFKKF